MTKRQKLLSLDAGQRLLAIILADLLEVSAANSDFDFAISPYAIREALDSGHHDDLVHLASSIDMGGFEADELTREANGILNICDGIVSLINELDPEQIRAIHHYDPIIFSGCSDDPELHDRLCFLARHNPDYVQISATVETPLQTRAAYQLMIERYENAPFWTANDDSSNYEWLISLLAELKLMRQPIERDTAPIPLFDHET